MITNDLCVTALNASMSILEVEGAPIERTTRQPHQYGPTDHHTRRLLSFFPSSGGVYITHLNSSIHFCSHLVRADERTTRECHQYLHTSRARSPSSHTVAGSTCARKRSRPPPPSSTTAFTPSPPADSSLANTSSPRVSNPLAQLRTCAMRCNGLSSMAYPSPTLISTS